MINKCFVFCLLVTTLFLTNCTTNYVYEEMHSIDEKGWTYTNTLDYNFEIKDTSKVYNLLLEIEHSTEYTYQNCYFKIHTKFPSGEKIEQVLSVDLANSIGQWQGDCSSNSCRILVDLQKKAFFNALGKHTITLEQFMRTSTLKGIQSLAIKLEDTGMTK